MNSFQRYTVKILYFKGDIRANNGQLNEQKKRVMHWLKNYYTDFTTHRILKWQTRTKLTRLLITKELNFLIIMSLPTYIRKDALLNELLFFFNYCLMKMHYTNIKYAAVNISSLCALKPKAKIIKIL